MSGPVPRIYVMVDEPPTFLASAVAMGATVLWEEREWPEFGARYAAFRDPWGAEICLWRDKGTYQAAAVRGEGEFRPHLSPRNQPRRGGREKTSRTIGSKCSSGSVS